MENVELNYWWLSAGGLCFLTALLHLIGGHFDPVKPFLQSDVNPVTKATLYACWHMVTIVLFSSALLIIYGALDQKQSLETAISFVSIQYILFALIFLVVAKRLALSNKLLSLPQWILLAPIGVMGLLGA